MVGDSLVEAHYSRILVMQMAKNKHRMTRDPSILSHPTVNPESLMCQNLVRIANLLTLTSLCFTEGDVSRAVLTSPTFEGVPLL